MKSIKHYNSKTLLVLGLAVLTLIGCERDLSDEAEFATFAKTGPIFTDTFIGLGTNFFFPFVSDGAKADVFSVDETQGYESRASIRIDVPNANDPDGNFAGAIFLIDGAGRNLTEFDALTFWAKSSQAATIGTVGFGEGKYQVLRSNLGFTTVWKKFIIPIPDPSKLIEEKGMFIFSAGGIGPVGQEVGYTFWLDEIQFEKLGTLGQPRPAILNGENVSQQSFNTAVIPIGGLSQTFNTASGENLTVTAAPSYFDFTSSDIEVARVSELGEVSLIGNGTSEITASLGNVGAAGLLLIESVGDITSALPPDQDPNDVISLFSDAFTNINVNTFNTGWDGSTQVSDLNIDGDNFKYYTNLNTFFAIEFTNSIVDATTKNFLHLDVLTNSTAGQDFVIQVRDIGANGEIESDNNGFPNGDDADVRYTVSTNDINASSGQWISIDIPLNGALADQKNNIGYIIVVGDINFVLDNVYFY